MKKTDLQYEKLFEETFKTYFVSLTHFAQKYIIDTDSSKEIVHNVFLSLWEKREKIDFNQSLKPYLFTSTYNRCLNFIRDNKKFNNNALSLYTLEQNTTTNNYDALVGSEIIGEIEQAIEKLPEKCRLIFTLSRFDELKYAEIADKLNISIKTVEAQMSKALKILKEELAQYLPLYICWLFFGKYLL